MKYNISKARYKALMKKLEHFNLIDERAQEIHPSVIWWNGHIYYQLNLSVLRPIKDEEVLK